VKKRLGERLKRAVMFASLDDSAIDHLIDAIEQVKIAEADKIVIAEGDYGDCMYMVEAGTLRCSKVINKES
jgi:hypothetical protein